MPHHTWILAADRSKARIFEILKRHDPPTEIADFVHALGRAHERDINSDASGRFYGKGEHVQGHATSTDVSVMRHEAERFAEQLCDYLYHAHSERRFEKLWIVAGPEFLGVLRAKLPKQLRAIMELELDKDVTTHNPDDIRDMALLERERQAERQAQRGGA
jgi:protein required for attachment to host cells